MRYCLDGMERVGDETTMTNNNAEVKGKEVNVNVPSKPEGHVVLDSQSVNEPVKSDCPGRSLHRNVDATEDKDLSGCVISLAGSGLPHASHYSTDDSGTRVAVEELKVGSFRSSSLRLMGGTSSSKLEKFEHLHRLASVFGLKGVDGDSDSQPQDMDQMLLKIRQQLARTPPERQSVELFASKWSDQSPGAISAFLRASGSKNTSDAAAPAQLKTSSTSSFSQLLLKRTLKGKGIVGRNQETHAELDSENVGCKDERAEDAPRTASDALPRQGAKNDMLNLHGVDRSSGKSSQYGINLREWLKPGCPRRDKVQRLNLFRQIVELVDSAHSQGLVLQRIRPSLFTLSPSDKVMYAGSFGKKEVNSLVSGELNKKRPARQELSANFRDLKQQKLDLNMHSQGNQPQFTSGWRTRNKVRNEIDLNVIDLQDPGCADLPFDDNLSYNTTSLMSRKQSISSTLRLEEQWYACPEQLNGTGCRSKSNIYELGVLLFELLCSCESNEVHSVVMSDLHHRILPPRFLSENPREAGFCLWLLHPEPSSRPRAREILQSELCHDDSSTSAAGDDEESELLLHFLSSIKEQKQKHASKLVQDIQSLEEDIKEAVTRYSSRRFVASSQDVNERNRQLDLEDASSASLSSTSYVPNMNENRLMRNISQLEDAYFFMRSQMHSTDSAAASHSDKNLLKDRDRWLDVQTDNKDTRMKEKSADKLEVFFEGLCKFARYSKFEVCGTIRSGDLLNSANVICSLSFDRDEEHIAAAGISKRIKIFDFGAFMNDSAGVHYPVVEMFNKSILSCVCWNSYIKNYLGSTDYDGVVQIWDAGTGQGFSQYTEHQKRAWSVDFSPSDPTKFASGSDDCSVKLWSINEKRSIGTIWSPANVCCVQFSASSNHLLSFGSADYKVYCYDLRHARIPWCTLSGHEKAVSYVKFLDSETIVSASTDNSLKLWNLSKTCSTGSSSGACTLTFKGHTNQKNFVGLSVLDGHIACGSETNEVYNYYRSLPMPITSYKFGSVDPISGHEFDENNGQFVSSVCWRRKSNMLVAANSTGNMKLLKLV